MRIKVDRMVTDTEELLVINSTKLAKSYEKLKP